MGECGAFGVVIRRLKVLFQTTNRSATIHPACHIKVLIMNIPLALTYDDVLIVPRRSTLASRKEASTTTKLTRNLSINIPIISSNMDTVTESEMAIALARLGGIGIIHRFMTIEENVEEVKRVKRAQKKKLFAIVL